MASILTGFQRLRSLNLDLHHQELRPELLQRPGQFLRFGVLLNQVKDLQVACRIPHHPPRSPSIEKANVAMMELNGFLLQPGAFFRAQFKTVIAAVAFWRYLATLAR